MEFFKEVKNEEFKILSIFVDGQIAHKKNYVLSDNILIPEFFFSFKHDMIVEKL